MVKQYGCVSWLYGFTGYIVLVSCTGCVVVLLMVVLVEPQTSCTGCVVVLVCGCTSCVVVLVVWLYWSCGCGCVVVWLY